jgi:hypothetical protein
MITQHDHQYDYYYDTRLQIHEIYHYEYDDQGRKISMWYGIGEDTDEAIVVDGYFGPTYYFYDEEGKLRMSHVQNKTQIQVDKAHTQITDLESAFDSLMGGVSIALGL